MLTPLSIAIRALLIACVALVLVSVLLQAHVAKLRAEAADRCLANGGVYEPRPNGPGRCVMPPKREPVLL